MGQKLTRYATTEKAITLADSPYTASPNFNCIKVNTAGGNVRVNLPTADYPIDVIKTSSDAYIVTIWVSGTQIGEVAGELSVVTIENAEVTKDEPWYPYDAIVGIAGVSGDGGEVLAKDRFGRVIAGGRGVAGTDDSDIGQSAVSVGNRIYFSPGVYYIKTPISYIPPKEIFGSRRSTIFVPDNALGVFDINDGGSHVTGDDIHDVTFDGSYTTQTGYVCVKRYRCHNNISRNIFYFGIKGGLFEHTTCWTNIFDKFIGQTNGSDYTIEIKNGDIYSSAVFISNSTLENPTNGTNTPLVYIDTLTSDVHLNNIHSEGYSSLLYIPSTASSFNFIDCTQIDAHNRTYVFDVPGGIYNNIFHRPAVAASCFKFTGLGHVAEISNLKCRDATYAITLDGFGNGSVLTLNNFSVRYSQGVLYRGSSVWCEFQISNGSVVYNTKTAIDVDQCTAATINNVMFLNNRFDADNIYYMIRANLSHSTINVSGCNFDSVDATYGSQKYCVYTGGVACFFVNNIINSSHAASRITDMLSTYADNNQGWRIKSSGFETGTGSEQAIPHGLVVIPTGCKAWIKIEYPVGSGRYITKDIPYDVTYVYPTVDNGVAFEWGIA